MSSHLDAILPILERLVAFDTTSTNSNLELIGYIEQLLAADGVAIHRIPDPALPKSSLWVTIGPKDRAGWILSAHTDTVPVTGQAWTSDPYRLRRDGDRVYARGAVDMKGFLAVCLAMVPAMRKAPLLAPIHLAISYDEEIGCVGVRPMLKAISKISPRPRGCFVGEPTAMQTVIGHKSKYSMRAMVRGKACHSAVTTDGVNAVEAAAELILLIRRKAAELAATGARDPMHEVPFTTGLTTIVEGEIANNIVPDHCEVEFEFRAIAADDPKALSEAVIAEARTEIEPWMTARDSRCGIDFVEVVEYPGLETPSNAEVVHLAHALGCAPASKKVPFGTEAGLFQSLAGIPSVVVGPGSISQAHKPDEWVATEQLDAAASFIGRLIAHCTNNR